MTIVSRTLDGLAVLLVVVVYGVFIGGLLTGLVMSLRKDPTGTLAYLVYLLAFCAMIFWAANRAGDLLIRRRRSRRAPS